MLWTLPGMVLSLFLAAFFFAKLTSDTNHRLDPEYDYPKGWTSLTVGAMLLYVASYALGLGCIPWAQGELFRLEVRGIGTSICTATNWACKRDAENDWPWFGLTSCRQPPHIGHVSVTHECNNPKRCFQLVWRDLHSWLYLLLLRECPVSRLLRWLITRGSVSLKRRI